MKRAEKGIARGIEKERGKPGRENVKDKREGPCYKRRRDGKGNKREKGRGDRRGQEE